MYELDSVAFHEDQFWLMPDESDCDEILFWFYGRDPLKDSPFRIVESFSLSDDRIRLTVVDDETGSEVARFLMTPSWDGGFDLNQETQLLDEASKAMAAKAMEVVLRNIFSESRSYVVALKKALRMKNKTI